MTIIVIPKRKMLPLQEETTQPVPLSADGFVTLPTEIINNAAAIIVNADNIILNVTAIGVVDGKAGDNAASIIINAEAITLEVTDRGNADTTLQGNITIEADRITAEVTARGNGDTTLQGNITIETDRITVEVTNRTSADTTLQGNITVEADRITTEVTNRTNADGTLQGNITVEADRITTEVTARGDADGTLAGAIVVNADNILLRVSKATVISEINISSEEIRIATKFIELDANVLVTGDFKVRGEIEADETLTVTGTLSAGEGAVTLGISGIIIEGQFLNFRSGEDINHFIWASATGLHIVAGDDEDLYLSPTNGVIYFSQDLLPTGAYDLGATGSKVQEIHGVKAYISTRAVAPVGNNLFDQEVILWQHQQSKQLSQKQ